MKRIALMIPLLLVLAATAAGQDGSALQRGRELTRLFYDAKLDSLWEEFAPAMKESFGGPERLKAFREQVDRQVGREVSVFSEKADSVGSTTVYERISRFEKPPIPVLVQWSLAPGGTVVGFLVTVAKEAPSQHLEYQTKSELSLPFRGVWYVFWGGRALPQNQHARVNDQRFAYDLVIMKEGATHTGDGKRNEDYHCFGLPILAPGPGIVHAVENGVEDNVPGTMNAERPLGNHVILDHGNGEFSFLAHFRKGGLKVRKGDVVKAGDLLGECGNSGHSSEPHLHYHLQTTPEPFRGDGLPAQFTKYVADGQPVARGEPVRGQTISGSEP